MRKIVRLPLPPRAGAYLAKRQTTINSLSCVNVNTAWNYSRQTKSIAIHVLNTLREMSGSSFRCMYCEDSAGTDIEHFQPKSLYPGEMFKWNNLLLICSGCNRQKGEEFPLDSCSHPLLIDPTVDNPWDYLEFIPETGKLTAKFDREINDYMPKGVATVKVLQLSTREALEPGYRKSFRRIKIVVHDYLDGKISFTQMAMRLRDADEHGLLEWCFLYAGGNESPFKELHERDSLEWDHLLSLLF